METPEGKVSLLDAVPVRCDHILTRMGGRLRCNLLSPLQV